VPYRLTFSNKHILIIRHLSPFPINLIYRLIFHTTLSNFLQHPNTHQQHKFPRYTPLPQQLLTKIKTHTHEHLYSHTHTHAHTRKLSTDFRETVWVGHNHPPPSTHPPYRGHTPPYLADFLRATKFRLFFRVLFGYYLWHLAHAFLIIARSVYRVPSVAYRVTYRASVFFESGNSAL
jgi:hypothetical protein